MYDYCVVIYNIRSCKERMKDFTAYYANFEAEDEW